MTSPACSSSPTTSTGAQPGGSCAGAGRQAGVQTAASGASGRAVPHVLRRPACPSQLPVAIALPRRPLWVCPDARVFLETFSPVYKQVRCDGLHSLPRLRCCNRVVWAALLLQGRMGMAVQLARVFDGCFDPQAHSTEPACAPAASNRPTTSSSPLPSPCPAQSESFPTCGALNCPCLRCCQLPACPLVLHGLWVWVAAPVCCSE